MSNSWKITIVGGSLNGIDFLFPSDKEVLIGRSSKADVRLSSLESDVSGQHLKLVYADGVPMAVNVTSRSHATFHQGIEMEPNGGSAVVSVHDAIELGASKSVRIRFDAVPASKPSFASDRESASTAATRWSAASLTGVPTAVIEESAVMQSEEVGATFATRVSETFATNVLRSTSDDDACPQDEETVPLSVGEDALLAPGDETTTNGVVADGDDGKTRDLETRPGAMDEIMALKAGLERKRKKRHVVVSFGFLIVVGMLAGLWFSSRTDRETGMMTFPVDAEGNPDIATYSVKDGQGRVLVAVDYPRDDGMSVTEAPDANGVTVVSAMGRDRDVPFFLQLEMVSQPEELERDLLSSVRSWISKAEESGLGYVFDIKVKDELGYRFFEDVFPGCCQTKSLYGVKFVTFDYKRTWADSKKTLWHGVLIYFRCGDTAFIHRREIPESQWVRGGYRIEQDPNIAIYSNFIDSYWECPGLDGLPMAQKTSELMESVRGMLAKERASDWRYAKKEIDAILAKTWRTDPKTRDIAVGCLRQFRDILRTYYYGKYNAFDNAKGNRDEKRMARLRMDAASVFDDPSERYYHLVANGEVW